MNILVISQRIPYPPNKGEKLRTFHQIIYLLSKGHTIHLAFPVSEDEELKLIEELKNDYRSLSVTFEKLKYKYIRYFSGILNFKPLSVSNFYSRKLQRKIDKIITSKDINAVLCTSSSMAEYVFCSKMASKSNDKLPVLKLIDFMDLDSDKWKQYAKSAGWPLNLIYSREARLLSEYEKRSQQSFDACFLISSNEVDLFNENYGRAGNVVELGNGIDTTCFYPAQSKEKNRQPVFIFTGVMDYKPNVDAVTWFVDKVWHSILSAYPEATFIIAGMKPDSKVLSLGKVKGVKVTGYVDDILIFYHQADYFVAPFRIARGVQNKILQAFACGLPVISTGMGAEGIKYQDKENIYLANTPDEFLKALHHLEHDHKLRDKLKHNALKLVHEEYSWDGKLKALDEFLP